MEVMIINQCSHNKGDRAVLFFIIRELVKNDISHITISTSDLSLWDKEFISHFPETHIMFVPYGWQDFSFQGVGSLSTLCQVLPSSLIDRFRTYLMILALDSMTFPSTCLKILYNAEFVNGLTRADLIISTGGHHVTNILSGESITPQLFDMAAAILSGKRFVLWSQSIGPISYTSKMKRQFVSNILSNSDAIYIREDESLKLLNQFNVPNNIIRHTFESVIGLRDILTTCRLPIDRDNIIGLSIYSAQPRNSEEHTKYVYAISNFVNHIVDRNYVPLFIPMELKGQAADDRWLINEIIESTKYPEKSLIVDSDADTRTHLKCVSQCKVFVGHKTHSIIFALTTGTPIIALAYHVKAVKFMEQYSLDSFCIHDRDLTYHNLIRLFDIAIDDIDTLGKHIIKRTHELGHRIETDFKMMLRAAIPAGGGRKVVFEVDGST